MNERSVGRGDGRTETAGSVVTGLNGARMRHVAVGHPLDHTRHTLETSVADHLPGSDSPGVCPG